jgi:hypothetical protein
MSILGVVLLVGSQAATSPAAAAGPRPRETLEELQQVLAKAWVAGDRATIERVIAPEWTTTGPDGTVRTREQVLGEIFETRVHRIQQMAIDGVEVRLFDDAAVVSGRTRALGEFGGQRYDVRIRFTDVFIKRRGQWQAVASHASLIGDPR